MIESGTKLKRNLKGKERKSYKIFNYLWLTCKYLRQSCSSCFLMWRGYLPLLLCFNRIRVVGHHKSLFWIVSWCHSILFSLFLAVTLSPLVCSFIGVFMRWDWPGCAIRLPKFGSFSYQACTQTTGLKQRSIPSPFTNFMPPLCQICQAGCVFKHKEAKPDCLIKRPENYAQTQPMG